MYFSLECWCLLYHINGRKRSDIIYFGITFLDHKNPAVWQRDEDFLYPVHILYLFQMVFQDRTEQFFIWSCKDFWFGCTKKSFVQKHCNRSDVDSDTVYIVCLWNVTAANTACFAYLSNGNMVYVSQKGTLFGRLISQRISRPD